VQRPGAFGHLELDDAQLAQDARTTVCAAQSALLALNSVASAVASAGFRVSLVDDDGEPLVLCPRGGAIELAARAGHPACLSFEARTPAAPRVKLGGRLVLTATAVAGRPGVTVAALRVERVAVGCPDRSGRVRRDWHELPLQAYVHAEPDALAGRLPALMRHLNGRHPEMVRQLAARFAQPPRAAVGAALLTGLDATSATVSWADEDGGGQSVVAFARPATSIAEIGARLRACAG
jgi:hypothetical protein